VIVVGLDLETPLLFEDVLDSRVEDMIEAEASDGIPPLGSIVAPIYPAPIDGISDHATHHKDDGKYHQYGRDPSHGRFVPAPAARYPVAIENPTKRKVFVMLRSG
jgi:hypothetical protein